MGSHSLPTAAATAGQRQARWLCGDAVESNARDTAVNASTNGATSRCTGGLQSQVAPTRCAGAGIKPVLSCRLPRQRPGAVRSQPSANADAARSSGTPTLTRTMACAFMPTGTMPHGSVPLPVTARCPLRMHPVTELSIPRVGLGIPVCGLVGSRRSRSDPGAPQSQLSRAARKLCSEVHALTLYTPATSGLRFLQVRRADCDLITTDCNLITTDDD